jgi:hypothetical protein
MPAFMARRPMDHEATEYKVVIRDLSIIGIVHPSGNGRFVMDFTDEDFAALEDQLRVARRGGLLSGFKDHEL